MENLLRELRAAENRLDYYRGKLESGSARNEEVENLYRKELIQSADDIEDIKRLINLQKKGQKKCKR
jgi:hypothetical protein